MKLSAVSVGKPCKIIKLSLAESDKARLWELGIEVNSVITVVKIFVGKTLLICCDSALAAVGKGVADGTEVEYV